MDCFCLVTNKDKDKNLEMTMHIKDYLESHGKKCVIAENIDKQESDNKVSRDFLSVIPEEAECCIVLGGDGTMLQAARSAAYLDVPLIGVNLGTLGYLADVEVGNVDDALRQLLAGDYDIEDRMMLYGVVDDKHDYALNDIIITRAGEFSIINFDIYVNDMFLCNYHADGIAISTPTGSTGYSLSAGGPIVEPSANMILITPICPHTINSRSMVLSDKTKITVVMREGRGGTVQKSIAYFDGSGRLELQTGSRIEIERANKTTKIVKLNKVSFLQALGKKFDAK